MTAEQRNRPAAVGAARGPSRGLSLCKIAAASVVGNPIEIGDVMVNYGMTMGVVGATISEYFPGRVRYFGLLFVFVGASIIGGAGLPIPALALAEDLGWTTPLALIFALGGLFTIVGALWTTRLPTSRGAADSFAHVPEA